MESIIYKNKEYDSVLKLTIELNVSYPLIKSLIREGVSLEEAVEIGKGNDTSKAVIVAKHSSHSKTAHRQYEKRKLSAVNREKKLLESLTYNNKVYSSFNELSKEIKEDKNVIVPRSTLLNFLPKGYTVDEIIEKVKIARGIK